MPVTALACWAVRIAFTHAYCWPEVRRGAERYTQELGAALAARGHDVAILSSAWKATDSTLDGVRTVRLRRLRGNDYGHEADFARRIVPRLLAGRWDVVHSMGRRDALASIRVAKVRRRRTVFTDLGLPSREWWDPQGKEGRVVEAVVAGIDVYGCMSRCALEYLERDYGRTDGALTPGGVELSRFTPAEQRVPRPTLLFSAALTEPRKGLAVLLEALPLIAREEPDVALWLSGPGDPSDVLAPAPAAARERTELLDLGEPKEVHERYGRAWTTVLPSTHDSFGMALVESLACGTPLVVSTHSAPKELVTSGVTGELCEPGDATGLAAACLRAIELARKPGTVAACRTSAAAFDWRTSLAPAAERLYRGSGR